MPQSIKFVAFLLCVLNVASIFKPGWSFSEATQPIHLVKGRLVRTRAENVRLIGTAAVRMGGFLGAVLLAIDAFRREYDEPKAMPIVLAVFGVPALGITSVLYYLEWGNTPTKRPPSIAENFCDKCVSSTRPERIMEMAASHRVINLRLVGSMRRCPVCGSVIKTLWLWFLLPLLPLCSYRVLPNAEASIGIATAKVRRLPWMDWTQVGIRYFILVLIAAGVTVIVIL